MSEPVTDSFIESIASELRRPVRLDARFDDRVMAAIESPDVIPMHHSIPRPWIFRPWTISVPRIGALAAAAVLALAVALGVWREGAPEPLTATVPVADSLMVPVASTPSQRVHQFLIVVPSARKIALIGDFNDWDASRTTMTRVNDQGLWSVTIPLGEGLHQFQYLVDDTLRINDPTLPKASNAYGSANSVITITPRDE